jgi:hypothetical protein
MIIKELTMKQKIESLLSQANINIINIDVLGSYVHIDSYSKYQTKLEDLMTSAGFKIVKSSNCNHLDDFNGYRLSVKI